MSVISIFAESTDIYKSVLESSQIFDSKPENTCTEHPVVEDSCSHLIRTFIESEVENLSVLPVTRFFSSSKTNVNLGMYS